MKKLIIGLMAVSIAGLANAADQAVVDRYNKACVVCHASGAANAPKTGVAADWEPRLAKGMDALVQSVDKGMGAMPPKGMCFDCTADDYKALIEYMAGGQ
jgi:cytochrome c5